MNGIHPGAGPNWMKLSKPATRDTLHNMSARSLILSTLRQSYTRDTLHNMSARSNDLTATTRDRHHNIHNMWAGSLALLG